MALDLYAITKAIATQIDTGTNRAIATYALVPPATPQFPCVIVRANEQFVTYFDTFGDNRLCDVQLELLVMHQGTSDEDSQIAVLDMLSAGAGKTNSVIDALMADQTLGGTVQTCIVTTASGLSKSTQADGSEPVMAVLSMQVWLRR